LQALRILRRDGSFDLVITDHIMPGMMGSELVTSIAAEWPGLPVVLVTGYGEQVIPADRKVPLLIKPFTQDTLARAVAAHAKTRNSGRVLTFRPSAAKDRTS
jgi:DNA-binding NtrC family response regulator